MDYYLLTDLAATMGYHLAMSGAETFRVEDTIHRILRAYGVECEVFAIPNCVSVSLEAANGKPLMINTDSSWQGMWAPLWQTTDNVTRKCIRLMKLFGINAVYSQRMNAASFYDIADEEGFLCVERCELSYDEFNNHTPAECAQMWRVCTP